MAALSDTSDNQRDTNGKTFPGEAIVKKFHFAHSLLSEFVLGILSSSITKSRYMNEMRELQH